MKILIACEESQVVTKAFRDKGHEAHSCDIIPCSGGHPEWHHQRDVKEVSKYLWGIEDVHKWHWDIIIAFPPCTDICVSGARWFPEKIADGRQQKAIDFFMWFANHPCPKIAIENPVGIMSRIYRKPDQIIQPWQFGDDASKKTCLWLKGLPKLESTNIIIKDRYSNQTASGQNKLGPSDERAKLRSKTYQGIADAMAQQWG